MLEQLMSGWSIIRVRKHVKAVLDNEKQKGNYSSISNMLEDKYGAFTPYRQDGRRDKPWKL